MFSPPIASHHLHYNHRRSPKAAGACRTRSRKRQEAKRNSKVGRVELDVGGTRFTTTLATLGDSVLAALFYGGVGSDEAREGCEAVFIDRDPQAFASILQWLRTGVMPNVACPAQRQVLLQEATHYGLDQLVQLLEEAETERQLVHEDHAYANLPAEENAQLGAGQPLAVISRAQFLDLVNRPRPAMLNGSDLRGFDLFGMDLREANLHRCNLAGADLRNARLDGACLVECCLHQANLSGASLTGADLTDADCRQADLTGADLREAKGLVASETPLLEKAAPATPEESALLDQ